MLSVLAWAQEFMSGNCGYQEMIQSRPWSGGSGLLGVPHPS